MKLYAVPEQEKCPTQLYGSRRVLMPDLVGERFDDASRVLDEAGIDEALRFHAHTGELLDDEPSDLADWEVCRQQPDPDAEVLGGTRPKLWLIGPATPCAKPSPKPRPAPKPKPAPKPSYGTASGGTSGSGSTGNSTGGGSTSGGSTGGGSSNGSGGTTGTTGSTGGTGSQGGVQFGQFCSPVGATATTTDGRPAKCFMGKDGRARWGYNSG